LQRVYIDKLGETTSVEKPTSLCCFGCSDSDKDLGIDETAQRLRKDRERSGRKTLEQERRPQIE
jgi:hypothetical protein